MIEPEMAFADLADYMDTAEAMIKFVIREVLRKCPAEMDFFSRFMDKGLMDRLHNVVENEFARISYTEAVSLLEKPVFTLTIPSPGAVISRRSMNGISQSSISRSPCLSPTTPRKSRPFTCGSMMTAKPLPLRTAWFPVSVKS